MFRGRCHSSLKFAQTGNWDYEFVTVGAFRFARTVYCLVVRDRKDSAFFPTHGFESSCKELVSWIAAPLLCSLRSNLLFSTNVCLFARSVRLLQQPIL